VDTSPAGATHLAEFDGQTATSIIWTVNATIGTSFPADPYSAVR
jgi:hypothetical protein